MAPYGVMGGDRDRDGMLAGDELAPGDSEDEQTLLEANLMSNITPQSPRCFNQGGGVWYQLERYVQDDLVRQNGMTLWEFTGVIFYPNETIEKIGPQGDIYVPRALFAVIVRELDDGSPTAVAFVFPHYKDLPAGGCVPAASRFDDSSHLTSVDNVESLTGLDFFPDLDPQVEANIEAANSATVWSRDFRDQGVKVTEVLQTSRSYPDVATTPASEPASTGISQTGSETMNEMLQFFALIAGTIIVAGILGGLISYVLYVDDDRPTALWHSVLLGIGAATLVPLFLQMISSNVLSVFSDIADSNGQKTATGLLVLFAFCALSAMISRSFLLNMSGRLSAQLGEGPGEPHARTEQLKDAQALDLASEQLDAGGEQIERRRLHAALERASGRVQREISKAARTAIDQSLSDNDELGAQRAAEILRVLLSGRRRKSHPDHAALGRAYAAQEAWPQALEAFSQAIKLRDSSNQPGHGDYDLSRAFAHYFSDADDFDEKTKDAINGDLAQARRRLPQGWSFP